eukprot:gnl/MRDRNA2_/MRDRNA2_20013_c0_seq1.p1 gnl/MRDRNA2_/MRDRNA2_20013_c0~~gnl/MRDRNA2_/MRDRNA2_20013_c0_seq1.p1  ORF type:complete len:464 (-),score=68.91 gnl/MRDRNA2_/MRDRNA2_20013_c0_seq1:294-1589(-)
MPSSFLNAKAYSKEKGLRQQVWAFLQDPTTSLAATVYSLASPVLVLFTVILAFLSTVADMSSSIDDLSRLDLLMDCFFASELLLRLVVCPSKLGFIRNWYNIIDILSILPLPFKILLGFRLPGDMLTTENTVLHAAVICVVPTMRLVKTTRHFWGLRILVKSLETAAEALPVPSYMLLVIMVTFSSMLFLIEPRSSLASMSDALWFVLVTVSTVGYGELTPETQAGRAISAILIVVGVLYTAMPIQIVGDAFTEVWKNRDKILLLERARDRLAQWGYSAEDVEILFEHFDRDGDGELNVDEFRRMMHQLHLGISELRIVQLFHVLDVDGGGTICAAEFLNFMFPQWVTFAYFEDEHEAQVQETQVQEGSCKSEPSSPGGASFEQGATPGASFEQGASQGASFEAGAHKDSVQPPVNDEPVNGAAKRASPSA